MIKPELDLCLGYELELCREAVRLTKEQRKSIQQAMWGARDQQHRLENWSISSNSKARKVLSHPRMRRSLRWKGASNRWRTGSTSVPDRHAAKGVRQRPSQLQHSWHCWLLRRPRRPVQRQRPWLEQSPTSKRKASEHIARSEHSNFQGGLHGEEDDQSRVVLFASKSLLFLQRKCADTACTRPHVFVACGGPRPYDDCRCAQA